MFHCLYEIFDRNKLAIWYLREAGKKKKKIQKIDEIIVDKIIPFQWKKTEFSDTIDISTLFMETTNKYAINEIVYIIIKLAVTIAQ